MPAATIAHRQTVPFSSTFGHIQRLWSTKWQCDSIRIKPGEYYVTGSDEVIITVLGSCIATCIRDPETGIGGMNHFMLPMNSRGSAGKYSKLCYGSHAMEMLINDILKQDGRREHLEVKIFGGGEILGSGIGRLNIAFIREYVDKEGLHLASENVGDICGRKVIYFPASGRAMVRKVQQSMQWHGIAERECFYHQQLKQYPPEGEIELFDD